MKNSRAVGRTDGRPSIRATWVLGAVVMLTGFAGSPLFGQGIRDDAGTGGGGTMTTGGGGGTGGGTQFQREEVDMSAFDEVERGESIGRSETQGFGIAAESTSGAGGAGLGGGGLGGGGLGGLGGLFGALGNAFGGQQGASEEPVIRVRLKSAVEVEPRSPEMVQQSASRVLEVAPPRVGVSGVNVTMNGSTAVLSGTVTNAKDRRMSELLMRLEPGVRAIDNRIEVVGSPSDR